MRILIGCSNVLVHQDIFMTFQIAPKENIKHSSIYLQTVTAAVGCIYSVSLAMIAHVSQQKWLPPGKSGRSPEIIVGLVSVLFEILNANSLKQYTVQSCLADFELWYDILQLIVIFILIFEMVWNYSAYFLLPKEYCKS